MIAHKETVVWIFNQEDWCVFPPHSVVSNYCENNCSNGRCRARAVLVKTAVEKLVFIVKFIVCVTYSHGAWHSWNTSVIHTITLVSLQLHSVKCILLLRRPSYGDPVHRASLCPGGRESHLHLPGHCQPSHHGLQVGMRSLTSNTKSKTNNTTDFSSIVVTLCPGQDALYFFKCWLMFFRDSVSFTTHSLTSGAEPQFCLLPIDFLSSIPICL